MDHSITTAQRLRDWLHLHELRDRPACYSEVCPPLWFAATQHGRWLPLLFPQLPTHPSTWGEAVLGEWTLLSDVPQGVALVAHPGRPCGRKLTAGSAVYRCAECGFDDLCVLCSHCFLPSDHEGHRVLVYVARDGSGMCDCGDPEAWNCTLNCKCTSAQTDATAGASIPADVLEALQSTVDVAFDFIISTFEESVLTLTPVHRYFNENPEELLTRCPGVGEFGLVLYNDENHNWEDATSRITACIECDRQTASNVALSIDTVGRHLMMTQSLPQWLKAAKDRLETTGLVATITPIDLYRREEVATQCVEWLMKLTQFPNVAFQLAARRAICRSLTSLLLEFHTILRCTPSGLDAAANGLSSENRIPFGERLVERPLALEPFQSRIQCIMYYDIRFWKQLRTNMHELTVGVLASDLEYKRRFCEQFVEMYGCLLLLKAKLDREWHLHMIEEATTQLFTCPMNVEMIVERGWLTNIAQAAMSVLRSQCSPRSSAHPNPRDRSPSVLLELVFHPDLSLDSAVVISDLASRVFNDLIYILEVSSEKHLSYLRELWDSLVQLVLLFQSSWLVTRRVGTHVEIEDSRWQLHFTYALHVALMIQKMAPGARPPTLEETQAGMWGLRQLRVQGVAAKILEVLNPRRHTAYVDGVQVFEYRVLSLPTAFINPLNLLLSWVLEQEGVAGVSMLPLDVLLPVADVLLRLIVLCAQVRTGFWVRNGLLVVHQALLYSRLMLNRGGHARDVHLNQIAALATAAEGTTHLERFVYNTLERWELLQWFVGKEEWGSTVYDDRIALVVGEFVFYVYKLLGLRELFVVELSPQRRMRDYARRVVCFCLAGGPRTYSDLQRHLPDVVSTYKQLEEVLGEVAEFTPPLSLSDTGLYRLRSKLYGQLDPLDSAADVFRGPELENALRAALSEQQQCKPDAVVLMPHFQPMAMAYLAIGAFTRTRAFAKVVYKLIQQAVEHELSLDVYMPQLLHLLHAVLVDYEKSSTHDKELPSVYLDYPVCNLLLAVANLGMLLEIRSKADYLLQYISERDSSVVPRLVDAFGQEYVDRYRSKGGRLELARDRQRRLAKERKERIFAKFARRQQEFVELHPQDANEDDGTSVGQGGTANMWLASARECILCQQVEKPGELFGIPVWLSSLTVYSRLQVGGTEEDSTAVAEAIEDALLPWPEEPFAGVNPHAADQWHGARLFGRSRPRPLPQLRGLLLLATSCGHGMHHSCFKELVRNDVRPGVQFECPLCRSANNAFMPLFLPPEDGGWGNDLAGLWARAAPTTTRYYLMWDSQSMQNCTLVLDRFVHPETLSKIPKWTVELSKDPRTGDSQFKWSVRSVRSRMYVQRRTLLLLLLHSSPPGNESFADAIRRLVFEHYSIMCSRALPMMALEMLKQQLHMVTNTIMAHERASRLVGPLLHRLFSALKEKDRWLLRSLVQMRAVVGSHMDDVVACAKTEQASFLLNGGTPWWEVYDGFPFGEFVEMFFLGAESFDTVARVVVAKELARLSAAISAQAREGGAAAAAIARLCGDGLDGVTVAVSRCLLPLYRCLWIFRSVLLPEAEAEATDSGLLAALDGVLHDSAVLVLASHLALPSPGEVMCAPPGSLEELVCKTATFLAAATTTTPMEFEYPGVVRLIGMPSLLHDFVHGLEQQSGGSARLDYYHCLVCGACLLLEDGHPHEAYDKIGKHTDKCLGPVGVFFQPSENLILLMEQRGPGSPPEPEVDEQHPWRPLRLPVSVALPYLNKHGETLVLVLRVGQLAWLNMERWRELNRRWVTGELVVHMAQVRQFTARALNTINVDGVDIDLTEDEEEGLLRAAAAMPEGLEMDGRLNGESESESEEDADPARDTSRGVLAFVRAAQQLFLRRAGQRTEGVSSGDEAADDASEEASEDAGEDTGEDADGDADMERST